MRLLLIRHGQSLGNIEQRIQGDDDPLTDLGRAQALAAGKHLAARGDITHLYASSLDRARETATIISREIGINPLLVPGLAEINTGTAAGLLWAEWQDQFPEDAARLHNDSTLMEAWPGGENAATFSLRVIGAYQEIVTRHLGSKDVVALVSHGGALSWIAAQLHDDPLNAWPSQRGGFHNCSVSELAIAADGSIVLGLWNQDHHLDALS